MLNFAKRKTAKKAAKKKCSTPMERKIRGIKMKRSSTTYKSKPSAKKAQARAKKDGYNTSVVENRCSKGTFHVFKGKK